MAAAACRSVATHKIRICNKISLAAHRQEHIYCLTCAAGLSGSTFCRYFSMRHRMTAPCRTPFNGQLPRRLDGPRLQAQAFLFRPNLLGHPKCRPRLRPSCIKRGMRQNFGNLLFRHAVILCILQMMPQRAVQNSACHQCRHGDDAAVPCGQLIFPCPNLAEQYIVVQLR